MSDRAAARSVALPHEVKSSSVMPETIRTLADVLSVHSARRPAALALEYEGRKTTFAELAQAAGKAAGGLRAAGVGRGDRVAVCSQNSDVFVELLFACGMLGAILAPINWRLTAHEVGYLLSDCEPTLVFVAAPFLATVSKALKTAGESGPDVNGLDLPDGPGEGYRQWRDAFSPISPSPVDPEDPALILYTSGTTGHPKGALLSHRALLKLREFEDQGPEWLSWRPHDICLVSMPLFHIGGIRHAVSALYFGATVLVIPQFEAGRVLEILSQRAVSKLFIVPSALQMLVQHPLARKTDTSRLKFVMYGASPISLALLEEAIGILRCGFIQAYGSTETAGGVFALAPESHDVSNPALMTSAGRAVAGVDVKILTPEGRELGHGEIGEVVICSPSNMSGYWRLPEATAEVLDADGWVRTGDAGYLDEDGYLFLRDRIKDMIISGGENVYPVEVENALASHPDVADVAVVGVPSQRWGEEVAAVVVLREHARASAEDLIAWTRQHVAAYKTPRHLRFLPDLPRNANGKVLKRELRRQLAPESVPPFPARS